MNSQEAANVIFEAGEMLRRVVWRGMSSNDPLSLPAEVQKHLGKAREAMYAAQRLLEAALAPDAVLSAMETETSPLPDSVAAAWDTEN